ncbi:MAG: hypothetical protein H6907_07665 [Hyphomicrobiales bacterium]|nr:hypothetical protein [Hyphomicrobiales bacterium]MCP5371595.1 hypothetical protein [Hyphomicrobiales bacterium]
MRDRPTGDELLDLARDILRGDLLAHVPADKKYQALMVANAMAIAARQMRAGDGPARDQLADLAALYGEAVPDGDPAAACRALYARLSADIRAGRFDPGRPGHDAARALVRAQAAQKVRESNPKYLDRA